jgi:hypothetical protein
MKKTIAILLVMTIALAGVFAIEGSTESKTLNLTTTVSGVQYMSLTSSEFEGTTVGAWNTFVAANSSPASVGVSATATDIAWFNLLNNQKNGVNVYMTTTAMISSTDTTNNTYIIDYTIECGEGLILTADGVGSQATIVSATNSAAPAGMFIESYAVNVELVATDLENAPADSYVATTTFNFTSV